MCFSCSLSHSQVLEQLNLLAEMLLDMSKCTQVPRSAPHCRESTALFILLLINDRGYPYDILAWDPQIR